MGEGFMGEEGSELEDYGRFEQAAQEAPARQCLEAEQWVVSALWRWRLGGQGDSRASSGIDGVWRCMEAYY